jgi:hypothetical protein
MHESLSIIILRLLTMVDWCSELKLILLSRTLFLFSKMFFSIDVAYMQASLSLRYLYLNIHTSILSKFERRSTKIVNQTIKVHYSADVS